MIVHTIVFCYLQVLILQMKTDREDEFMLSDKT
jgi:hypothetical protein